MSDTEPAPRTAPRQLWLIAQAFLQALHMLFGNPEDVAAQGHLTRAAHTLMASWLRVGEAMMRRLLLIEAAALAKPKPQPPKPPRARVRRLMSFDADAPETWRVTFAQMERRRPAGMSQNWPARSRRSMRLASAWPLAERYEALIRAFNTPAPYARRLARQLHAAPQRCTELLRAPPEAPHRVEAFATLSDAAQHAAAGFNSS